MAIPQPYDVLFLPTLKLLAKAGGELSFDELEEKLAYQFNVSKADRERRHGKSNKKIFRNSRVGWAKDYLKQQGFAEFPVRNFVRITDLGRMLVAENPAKVDRAYLRQWKETRGKVL